MKNVKFQEVGMENYGPYIDPMILPFEDNKLTLITGPNGIGKTMSIDAIPFTLYGTTSKGAKGDDVVNNVVGKNCKTWIKFKVDDTQYLVTRYHKYSKLGNTVVINENGVDIKQGHKECLPLIERIVCPQKAFMNALMFGQKVKDFFTDLPDSQKKEIFRKVLDLEMFIVYYKYADQVLKDIAEQRSDLDKRNNINIGLLQDTNEQIQSLLRSKIDFEKKRHERIQEKQQVIKESERLLLQWKKGIQELQKNDINLEDTIVHLSSIEKSLTELAEVFKKRFSDLTNRKQSKILELKNHAQNVELQHKNKYGSQTEKLQMEKFDIKEKINTEISDLQQINLQYKVKINRLESKSEMVQEKINEIHHHVIDSDISECPTCHQEISDKTKIQLENKIINYNNELDNFKKEIAQYQTFIKTTDDKMEQIRVRGEITIKDLENQVRAICREELEENNKIESKLRSALEKVDELSRQEEKNIIEEEIKVSTDLTKEKEFLTEKRRIQETNIAELKAAEDSARNIEYDIKQTEREINEIEKSEYDETQLNNYLKKQREYEIAIIKGSEAIKEYDQLQEVALFWKTAFSSSGIPSMLIDEAIPYMNERVEHYLDLLTNGRYVVSFDTLAETKAGEFRDKISVHVLDTQTRANSRVQLSGGQTRIIDIAIILTLGDLLSSIQNISFNILLFDEIFDALDEQNIQYVSKVLSKLKIGKSIYIISHQHQDHLEADQVLAFS